MYTPISKPSLLKYFFIFTLVLSASFNSFGQSGRVYTAIGGGMDTSEGVPATSVTFAWSLGMGVDISGNIYFTDNNSNTVRKIDHATGLVYTVAGNKYIGSASGDGGPARAAGINDMRRISVTAEGHIYICCNSSIRRVDGYTGIITTVAGGGTSHADNIPATSAALGGVMCSHVDNEGNIYFSTDYKIKKVDGATGIIRTIAGNGRRVDSGNGIAATAAGFSGLSSITMDNEGNLYLVSGILGGGVRKINSSTGIVTTVAGGGSLTRDSILATDFNFSAIGLHDCVVDGLGNMFISSGGYGNRIWRVDASTGIMTTIAGKDGGSRSNGRPALATHIAPQFMLLDPISQHIYFNEGGSTRKFSYNPIYPFFLSARDTFYTQAHKRCIGPQLTVRVNRYHPGMRVRTDFGDGSYDTTAFNSSWSGNGGFALVNHNYSTYRTYNITQVLDSAGIPRDTITTAYNHVLCSDISVSFYNDMDVDCLKDSTEPFLMQQVLTEIDSNGIPVDTIASTSGFNYTAFGNPSDIYGFKVISSPIGLFTFCPVSGLIYDTLRTGISSNSLKMAFACSSSTGFIDLEARAFVPVTRPYGQWGHLYLNNNYCPSANGTVTLNFSPKYMFTGDASPTPTSYTATSITWNLSALTSLAEAPTDIYYGVEHNSAVPYPSDGDTVNERITITPTSGPPDSNMANNVVVRVDTVSTSCDPNAMEVVPGCFRNDTTFLCTIHFENIGSAPAENIYVMDTLSRYFDPSSIQIKMSTHPMFVTKYVAGGNTIMKFDFPNINLADSSDHLHRDGMLMYTIKNKPSLLGGLVLKSQAGIYFDYNDVLMTNIANVTVGCPWPLSTDDISSNNIPVTLHPNPATDELTITSPANKYERLSITNMLGERIMSLNLPKPTTTIDISTLPTGMYIVTLYGAKGSEVKKFVKE